jgi:hypothetical protein
VSPSQIGQKFIVETYQMERRDKPLTMQKILGFGTNPAR